MSAATIERNVGAPAVPFGAARNWFAVLLAYGFCESPYALGKSAATKARNVGTPAAPLGAARKLLAVLLAYGFCVSPYPLAKASVTAPVCDVVGVSGADP